MMSRLLVSLTAVLMLLGATRATAGASPRDARIRLLQPRLRAIFQIGLDRSPTLHDLADAVERSDVIVYVDLVPILPSGIAARLTLLYATESVRYLHIAIGSKCGEAMLIQLLGHELHHVVEVARDPTVRTHDALRALYQRIGVQSMRGRAFDSEAARVAEATIREDLSHSREPAEERDRSVGPGL